MPTSKKIELVDSLREKITRCTITVATNYTGLGVNSMTELRDKMREERNRISSSQEYSCVPGSRFGTSTPDQGHCSRAHCASFWV